jgi:hypothetical protein
MNLKNGQPCGHTGCLNHVTHPCEECGRVAGKYTSIDIGKFETELRYLERILGALKRNMSVQGITVAFRTNHGTDVITSTGNPPHLVMADDETWEEFQR